LLSAEYAAGFFDGEGCVQLRYSFSVGQYHKQLTATVGQSSLPVLEALQATYGGKIYKRKPAYQAHKQMWDWKIFTREAVAFFESIRPYLLVKRDQVAFVLEVWEFRANTEFYASKVEEYKERWSRSVAAA
jgi:hypothetical protein